MSSLAQTIDQALSNIGNGPRDVLLETLSSFDTLGLPDEARVSAIATALATTASLYHPQHIQKFLDAVQIWALEALTGKSPPLPVIQSRLDPHAVMEAAELLASGLGALLEALVKAHVPLQDRVVAELTLFTRLLSAHDVHTILLAVGSASDALAHPEYDKGDLIIVPLRDLPPLDREADLNFLPMLGRA